MRYRRISRYTGYVLYHILPVFSSIQRNIQVAIISPRPEKAWLDRRLGQADDGAMEFGCGVFCPSWSARSFLFFRVVCGQVWAYHLPG